MPGLRPATYPSPSSSFAVKRATIQPPCPSCGFTVSAIPHEKNGNTAGEIHRAIQKRLPILCTNQVDASSVRSSAVYLDPSLKIRQRKGKEGIYVTIRKS